MFDTRLELRLEARLATLRELAAALAAEQFCLVYQPKVDCRQGRVVGVEALLRWRHPTLGLLSPDEFVPLVEDTDLAVDIGQWTLRAVLVQMVAWQSAGIDLPVSVNAFTRHLLQPGFAAQLRALCEEFSGAGYGRLQIEIAETAALKELKAVREVMVACQAFEVGFALDDFGTGYSTLSHLRHLPAQEIKIDQSFVAHMIDRPEDRSIVVAVIGLAKAFDRAVVAVGAETRRHVVDLLAMGCDEVQGYALARPMVAADVPDWLAAFHPDGAWWRPDGADRELRG
jgi:EAL domain-containing protein (putative c-di-GMP-specific phosphodiesterase class I)